MKNGITRRRYAALLGGAVGMWAIALRAQPAERKCVVGVLMGLANDAEAQVRAKLIEQGLAKEGGSSVKIRDRIPVRDRRRRLMLSLSKELVALHSDVIIGHSTPVVAALHRRHRQFRLYLLSFPIRSAAALSQAWRGRAEMSPASPIFSPRLPANIYRY